MATWALVLGIIGTIAGLMAGGAAIYSLVISHRALNFEKEKWEESKQVKIRVGLRHELKAEPGEDDEARLVSVISMTAYNEGSVDVRLVHAYLEIGPDRYPWILMTEFEAPCKFLLVQPNDSRTVSAKCAPIAKWLHDNLGYTGDVEVHGFFYDSLRRVYTTTEPQYMRIEMFYRDGVVIEDPLKDAKLKTCPTDGRQCMVLPGTDGLVMRQQDEEEETPQ